MRVLLLLLSLINVAIMVAVVRRARRRRALDRAGRAIDLAGFDRAVGGAMSPGSVDAIAYAPNPAFRAFQAAHPRPVAACRRCKGIMTESLLADTFGCGACGFVMTRAAAEAMGSG